MTSRSLKVGGWGFPPPPPRGRDPGGGASPGLLPGRGSEAAGAPQSRAGPGRAWGARPALRRDLQQRRGSDRSASSRVAGNRSPPGDPPSTRGSGSGPEGEGCGAGSAPSRSGIALPFSQAAGTPSTWRLLRGRADRDERGRCPTVRVGNDQFF